MSPSSDSSGLISLGSLNMMGKLQSGSWGTWAFSTLSLIQFDLWQVIQLPCVSASLPFKVGLWPQSAILALPFCLSVLVSSLTRLSQLRTAAPHSVDCTPPSRPLTGQTYRVMQSSFLQVSCRS